MSFFKQVYITLPFCHVAKDNVTLQGTVAYVSQQAWIQNRSLKDGVIFDNKEDKKLYEKVIHACALKADLEMFAAGDQTEIGEKVRCLF